MAGTYSQIYLQYVIVVKYREILLSTEWRGEVFKYMSGIITAKKHKSIIVNGVEDHVHLFVGFKPSMNIPDLIRDIKNNSSNFINEQRYLRKRFSWQEGYGVFSYSHWQVSMIYNYILNQEAHHRKQTFKEEYKTLLKEFEVPHEDKYLFDFLE
jgi:putative transposase